MAGRIPACIYRAQMTNTVPEAAEPSALFLTKAAHPVGTPLFGLGSLRATYEEDGTSVPTPPPVTTSPGLHSAVPLLELM